MISAEPSIDPALMADGASPKIVRTVQHIPELDGLRGLLAWWVVLSHVLFLCGYNPGNLPRGVRILTYGSYAVYGFVILSGFVIFKLLAESKESYRVFITRRFFRLYPVYLVCLGGALILRFLLWSNMATPHYLIQQGIPDLSSESSRLFPHVLAHLTMLHALVPESLLAKSAIALFGPAWSISLEWQFYLVAPLFFAAVSRLRSWGLFLLAFLVCALSLLPDGSTTGILYYYSIPFGIGIISFYVFGVLPRGKFADVLAGGVTPLVLILTLNIPLAIWCWTLSAALADDGCQLAKIPKRLLNSRWVKCWGRLSYGIYLGHMCCVWTLQIGIHKLWPDISENQLLPLLLPSTLILTFITSLGLARYIETPGIRLGRRLAESMQSK